MPKFKVKVRQEEDPRYGIVTVEVKNKEAVEEAIDMLYQDDPDAFTWDELDLTKMDVVEIVSVEEVKDG